MTDFEVADLISKHLLKKITETEEIKLWDWTQKNEDNHKKFEELTNINLLMKKLSIFLSPEGKNTKKPSIPVKK